MPTHPRSLWPGGPRRPRAPRALLAGLALLCLPALARAAVHDGAGGSTDPAQQPAPAVVDQPASATPPAETVTPTPPEPGTPSPTAPPGGGTIVLYNAALGTGLPDTQGLAYLTRAADGTTLAATQVFTDGVTLLDTWAQTSDMAGYFPKPGLVTPQDRNMGFTVHFTVQITQEEHSASDKNGDGVGDRAGFSVIALAQDLRGIELGFWADEVWAQEDGPAEPPPNTNTLFTHAEGAAFDTLAGPVPYALRIGGERYTLSRLGAEGDTPILTGRLRDYSAFGWPYNVPGFLFFGDDTSTARGTVRFAYAALASAEAGTPPPVATASITPSPSPTRSPTPCPQATPEWLRVDPVRSPTWLGQQVIQARLGNGEWIEVEGPLGTFRADGSQVAIPVPLALGQLNELMVRGRVREIVHPDGCVYGGYTLSTRRDLNDGLLDILQRIALFLPMGLRGEAGR